MCVACAGLVLLSTTAHVGVSCWNKSVRVTEIIY